MVTVPINPTLKTPEKPLTTGPERIVVDSDGIPYYSPDHYKTFINLITGVTK